MNSEEEEEEDTHLPHHTRHCLTLSQPRIRTPLPSSPVSPLSTSSGSSTKAFVQSTVLFLFTLHLSSELSVRRAGDG